MPRALPALVILILLLSACRAAEVETSDVPDLPVVTADEFEARLASLDRPAVINVWASWCIPCRSEAPLLQAASDSFGDQIEFIGVNVQDSQPGAKSFIAEFGLEFEQVFDRERSIPNRLGGLGTPITFFIAPGGEVVITHNGIIDERALALGIDELLLR